MGTHTVRRFISVLAVLCSSFRLFAAPSIWLEGESFVSETPLKDLPGREKLPGGGRGYVVAGWGNRNVISGGELLHITLSEAEAGRYVPDTGLIVHRNFEVKEAGTYEIWARIGYEWVRSPFDWCLNDGPWTNIPPDLPTIDVQPIQVWNELGWLRLAEGVRLNAGRHRIAFRHLVPKKRDGNPDRILHMLDAVCVYGGAFQPFGKWAPDQDHRSEKDRAAESQIFDLNLNPGPDGRAWTMLNGLWQYAPWGETQFPITEQTRLKPVEALPDLSKLRWFAYEAPGAIDERLPEQAYTHRYLLRTRVRVPRDAAGRGIFLDVQNSTLIVSVFVNGRFAGSTDIFHAPWQIDLSPHIRAGHVNEIVLAIKGAYYSLNPTTDREADGVGQRRYWNLPREMLETNSGAGSKHDYPIAFDCRTGLLAPASLVVAGPVYASDVFVIPMEGRLGLETTLFNPTSSSAALQVDNEVVSWNEGRGGQAELRFPTQRLTLAAGESRTIRLDQQWANPRLWWPDQPFLYLAHTVVRSPRGVDTKQTRFGFRTFDWSTSEFRINGVPWQMWADLTTYSADPREQTRFARERSHANHTRYWHKGGLGSMTRREAMEHFDETGMLVRSSGTFDGQLANYGAGLLEEKPDGTRVAKQPFWDNWRRQLAAWVREERNHPSIYVWSVENEIAFINSHNLGLWREVEPELTRGVREVMHIDPTRPAMVDGGNALRDESLPVNGAHYTEFMNVAFRDFPDAAYTLEHFLDPARPQRGAWRKVPGRPIFGGEIYFAEGYDLADFATIGGERCFIGRLETYPARGLFAKMLSEGYRWAGYSAFHFWLAIPESETWNWNSWNPVALFCRQWNWTWGADTEITRTLKLFNTTSNDAPIEASWEFRIGDQRIAGETREFRLPCGGATEFNVAFRVPSLDAPAKGVFVLRAARGGQEVFREEKLVRILVPAKRPNPPIRPGEMAVLDPSGKLTAFLKQRGIPFTAVTDPENLPATARVLVVGPDGVTPDRSTDPVWLSLAAEGRKVVLLDQSHPLVYRALPGDYQPSDYVGRIAFPEDMSHPVFDGLTPADFFTWGNDHVIYRKVYRKGTSGGRSLVQCDFRLSHSAMIESEVNDGLLLISQLAIGDKLAREAVAQQMLLNILHRAAVHKPVRRVVKAVLPDGDRRWELLRQMKVQLSKVDSLEEALRGESLLVVDAKPDHLRALAERLRDVEAFQDRGGWLMLWGLEPDGLPFFNKIVRHEHLIRPFETERVVIRYPSDPLASGITLRDVVMDTGRQLYPWMALKAPDRDAFRYVVDHDDIAPFAKFPDGLVMGKGKARPGGDHEPRNLVNGFTSDDDWVFTYTTILDEGHSTRMPLELAREEELESLIVRPSRLYNPVTRLRIYFDDDPEPLEATLPVRDTPVNEEIALGGRRAKRVTIEIAGWAQRGDRNIVVLDNVWIIARRPESYRQRVSSLLNVGALMAYRRGKGGILLNQVHIAEREVNPDNAEKKARIVRALLTNLGAEFEGARVEVARERFEYHPIAIPDHAFNIYRDQRGQPSWPGGGDLSSLPAGRRKLAGVEFQLVDFATSPVPSAIALGGEGSPVSVDAVKGMPVGARADALFFLHTFHPGSAVPYWRADVEEAAKHNRELPRPPRAITYRVVYEDGSNADIPVLFSKHISAWNDQSPAPLPGADLAWTEQRPDGSSASVWLMRWTNPHPEKVIKEVDFIRVERWDLGTPILFAITRGNRVQ